VNKTNIYTLWEVEVQTEGVHMKSYNDSWIRKRLTAIEDELESLKKVKNLSSFMHPQGESGWSYDPQLPYYFHRKNEKFQYALIDLQVTGDGAESILNTMGDAGWMIAGMGLVDEDTGIAPFTFKLNLQSLDVNRTKFAYKCFSYELASSYLLEGILNELNKKEGYDFTCTAAFNKTHSFCLMTKVIY